MFPAAITSAGPANPQDVQTAALRAFLLQFAPEPPMPVAHVLDCLARMDFPIAISRNIRHAQVDAKRVVNVNRFWRFNLGSSEQVLLSAHERQIGFTASECEQRFLTFAAPERDFLPPVECPDRDSGVLVGIGQDVFIIGNRTKRRLMQSNACPARRGQ